jgi:hypothetical protein
LSENCTVYEIMSKNLVEREGPQKTSPDGACALHDRYARLHARTRAHACISWRTREPACARTQRQICNTNYFSTVKLIRERAPVIRYTYIECLVITIMINKKRCSYFPCLLLVCFATKKTLCKNIFLPPPPSLSLLSSIKSVWSSNLPPSVGFFSGRWGALRHYG